MSPYHWCVKNRLFLPGKIVCEQSTCAEKKKGPLRRTKRSEGKNDQKRARINRMPDVSEWTCCLGIFFSDLC